MQERAGVGDTFAASMHPAQMDDIVRRLVQNPADEAAIAQAHAAGQSDPRAYATVLERVGDQTSDAAYASYWLSEAAQVWSMTMNDARRAATLLMRAVDKDPSSDTAAERLAALYRDKGDQRALVALHKKRADALTPSATAKNADPARVQQVSMLHEELGRLWQEAPLSQPKKAIEHLKKAFEIDPAAISAVYAARELIKAHGDWREALPLYDLEADAVDDPERKVALHRDEAALCQTHGDNKRACEALRKARLIDSTDISLAYELASAIVARAVAGERMPDDERAEAADILVSLAEQYDGDHALAYSTAALDVQPGHERAMQLADHFSKSLGREDEIAPRWEAYLKANPEGLLVVDARKSLAGIYEQQGKLDAAITALSPLKDDPDPSIATRLTDLFTRAGKTTELAALIERQSSALPPAERLRKQAEIAGMLAQKGDKKAALAKYQEVLQGDPQHPEALSFVEHALRAGKQWKDLRELFLNAARSAGATSEARASWLREVAILSEQKLDDIEGAIEAHRQVLALDRGDELATAALHRLFEKTSRWDDLAAQLEQEAASAGDIEQQIALEKKLSDLHANKRGDKREAAEALLRVLQRAPKDDSVLGRAVDLLIDAGEQAKAASAIATTVEGLDDGAARGKFWSRLGEIREGLDDAAGASEAYSAAAEATDDEASWATAEAVAGKVERWEAAANAAGRRADLASDARETAKHRAREAEHLVCAGSIEAAIDRLERGLDGLVGDTDPELADQLGDRLEALLEREGRLEDLANRAANRGRNERDDARAVKHLKRAATLRKERLLDVEGARALRGEILARVEDSDTLHAMVDDARERGEHAEALDHLRRLEKIATSDGDRIKIALAEAALLADPIGDVAGALARYRDVLGKDDKCLPAWRAVADLEQRQGNTGASAKALTSALALANDAAEKAEIGRALGAAEEGLGNVDAAIAAYEAVVAADEGDFDSTAKLRALCERAGRWTRAVALIDAQIEAEVDEDEIAALEARKAEIVADELDQPEEALRGLAALSAGGSPVARKTAIAIADRHGADAQLGGQLLAWSRGSKGPEAQRLLGEAFDRFVRGDASDRALEIAPELLRTPKAKEEKFLDGLEAIATSAKNVDLVLEAHDRRASIVSGPARAAELVRQAVARVALGLSADEAISHAEMGLGFATPESAVEHLDTLASLATSAIGAVELFERHVARAKTPADKLTSLVRAFRVALDRATNAGADRKTLENKAKELAESVLSLPTSAGAEEAFEALYEAARAFDDRAGGQAQRRALLETIAASTAGPRDGGRTRSANLRRAALRARNDLADDRRALDLLAAALVAHVDAAALDAVEEAAGGDPRRAERVLSKALEEVFDGPLVRQILSRRAAIRQEKLADVDGAIADLKKLHELAPADAAITQRLDALLTEANDYRGRIQLLEDQILRSKEQGARAELARQIAWLWEERLGEAREAADAWRRVLRLKPQDPEATEGLDRAKRGKPKFEAGLYPPQREASKASDAPASDEPDTSPPAPSTTVDAPVDAPPASIAESPITTKIVDAASVSKLAAASASKVAASSVPKLAAASASKIATSSVATIATAAPVPEVTGDLDVSDAIDTTDDVGVDETMRRSSTTTIVTAAPALKRQSSAPPPLPEKPANRLPIIAKPIAPKVTQVDLPATTEEIAPPSAEALASARSLPELADDDDDVPTSAGHLDEARALAARTPAKTEEIAAVVIPAHLEGVRAGHADETGEIVGDDEFEVIEEAVEAVEASEATEAEPADDFADLADDDSIEQTRTEDVAFEAHEKSTRRRH